jgi:hypothetical protein
VTFQELANHYGTLIANRIWAELGEAELAQHSLSRLPSLLARSLDAASHHYYEMTENPFIYANMGHEAREDYRLMWQERCEDAKDLLDLVTAAEQILRDQGPLLKCA